MRLTLSLGARHRKKKRSRHMSVAAPRGVVGAALNFVTERTFVDALSSPRRLPLRQALQKVGCVASITETLFDSEQIGGNDRDAVMERVKEVNNLIRLRLGEERRRR